MKLSVNALGLSLGLSCAIFSAISALAIGMNLEFANKILGYIVQGSVSISSSDVPVAVTIVGVIVAFIFGYLFGAVVSLIYNKFEK